MYQAKVLRPKRVPATPNEFEVGSDEWEIHTTAIQDGDGKVTVLYPTDCVVLETRQLPVIDTAGKETLDVFFVSVLPDGRVGVFPFTDMVLDYEELKNQYGQGR